MPNTREKLIELLNEAEEYEVNTCMFHSKCEDCPGRKYGDNCRDYLKADHLIANGVTVQEWIPVTERLPEDSCRALIRSASGYIGVDSYDKDRGHFESGGMWIPVTHWMPLPQPPKGE